MKKIGILFFALFLNILSTKSQVIDSMINVYADQVPHEKVHLHFDKDVYRAGETIWFKAYLFAGFSLSHFSKNLYTELINEKGAILQRKVHPVVESAAAGHFDIPDTLAAGNLLVRAYTTWMMNFDTAFIFQKNILLVDLDGMPAKKVQPAEKNYSIRFFPEGGNMVNSLESVVSFKANDNTGMPVKMSGKIINTKKEVVATFSSVHNGMGTFTITPQLNETYSAVWTDASGKELTTALPAAKAEGYSLKISSVGKNKMFQVRRTDQVPQDWKKLNIIALLGQEKVYAAKVNLEAIPATSGLIPVDQLPSGLLQVTIFSDNWEPIAERIVMVNNNNYNFKAEIKTPVFNDNFRSKNTIEISIDDSLLTNLSLSVTDAALGKQTKPDNIISRLLLTGDLKGYIYNPSYYFSNLSDTTASHLDLVMLTHGWRRYNWAQLARGRKPAYKYPLEQYLTVEAKAFGVTTATPLRSDEQLFVIVESKDSSRQVFEMNKSGIDKFAAGSTIFFDTATAYYQFVQDKKADKDLTVVFNTNFYKGVRNINMDNNLAVVEIDSSVLSRTKYFAEKASPFNMRGKILETVVVKTKQKSRIQELDEMYATGMFRSADAYFFDFSEDRTAAGFIDVFSYLQGKVAGLQITGMGATAQLSWRGSKPLLYLNEFIAEPQTLASVNVADIAMIKVLRPPFFGGMGGGGGAIAVYTKRGSEARKSGIESKGLNKSRLIGYSTPKEFYSPDYKDLSVSSEVSADFRSTLLWNPIILLDGTRQKIKFDFYNNDITKAFRIVLEGVNEVGKVVRIERIVQANK